MSERTIRSRASLFYDAFENDGTRVNRKVDCNRGEARRRGPNLLFHADQCFY